MLHVELDVSGAKGGMKFEARYLVITPSAKGGMKFEAGGATLNPDH